MVLMKNHLVGVETNGLDAAGLDAKSQLEFTYQSFLAITHNTVAENQSWASISLLMSHIINTSFC